MSTESEESGPVHNLPPTTRRRLSDVELRAELSRLEDTYHMSSAEFYDAFREGQLPNADSPDFMRWAGLCYMALAHSPQGASS